MADPVTIEVDNSAITRELERARITKEHLQAIVDAYTAAGFGSALTTADLPLVESNPEKLLFDKFAEGKTAILELNLRMEKAFEVLNKPNGYDNVLALMKEFYSERRNHASSHPFIEASRFAITAGVVDLKAGEQAAITAAHTHKATTDNQIAVLTAVNNIIAALESIMSIGAVGHTVMFNPDQFVKEAISSNYRSNHSGGNPTGSFKGKQGINPAHPIACIKAA